MVIQSLEKRRGRQILVMFDDGSEQLLDRQTVEESPYRVGSEISEEQLAALTEASQRRRAKDYALYLLSLRDYSEAELRRKLRDKGYGDVAEEIAARVAELGFLNDEVYARRLARECRLRKLYSRRRTVQELCVRGVRREIAEDAVDEVDESENLTDLQQALALLEKKRYNASVTEPMRQRGSQLLMRNGYGGATVREAWRALSDAAAFGEDFIEIEE